MSTDTNLYPFDPTGKATTNLVKGERQTLAAPSMLDFFYIVPKSGPYFRESLKVTHYPGGKILKEGVDFTCTHLFYAATQSIGTGVYGSITFYDHTLTGSVALEYQTVGGDWTIDEARIVEILANYTLDPRITMWEQVTDVPYQFPPIAHEHNIDDFTGAKDIVDVLVTIKDAIAVSSGNALATHIADKENPHQVNKAQVGLSLVYNYAPATTQEATEGTLNTVYMTALRTRQAIDAVAKAYTDAHANRRDNPHEVNKTQVGLGNVENLPVANQVEAQQGASNIRYMTALRVKEAITAQVGTAFSTYVARRDNPNQVTKEQVGLGNVVNLPLATVDQARGGQVNNAYMTPALTAEAIRAMSSDTLTEHLNDLENPHEVTKLQVGLGLVPNFAKANQTDAEAGARDDLFMTPLQTRYAIAKMADATVGEHATRTDNPHNVTKEQVGLDNVLNYGIASDEAARVATANDLYMTPYLTTLAINERVGIYDDHLNDNTNPHNVTAAQLGVYLSGQVDTLVNAKLDRTATAVDATLAYGMTKAQLTAEILQGKAADSALLGGQNFDQIRTTILQGNAASADKLNGLTANDIVSQATEQSELLNRELYLPAITPVTNASGTTITLDQSWTQFGYIRLDQSLGDTPVDVSFLVMGGDTPNGPVAPTKLCTVTFASAFDANGKATVTSLTMTPLNGSAFASQNIMANPGVLADNTPVLNLWLKDARLRKAAVIRDLSDGRLVRLEVQPIDSWEEMTKTEPGNAQYFIGLPVETSPVMGAVTIAAGAAYEADLQNLLGVGASYYDLQGAQITLRVKDTQASSQTFGSYINAEGIATYGIRDNRYLRIVNQYDAAMDFYVRAVVTRKSA